MMAAPGTTQGESGWYFDVDGSRSQWHVEGTEWDPVWTIVQQFKEDTTEDGAVTWVKVDLGAAVVEPTEAESKFTECDLDGDGLLTAKELEVAVSWVFSVFFPLRELTDEERTSEAMRLLRGLDKNEDAQVGYGYGYGEGSGERLGLGLGWARGMPRGLAPPQNDQVDFAEFESWYMLKQQQLLTLQSKRKNKQVAEDLSGPETVSMEALNKHNE
eukprot:TRINITY_DN3498_c0_g1_i5.p1 TRINITY_DN3498_c0_g1~~TRINITY_DN3498_c0_g1_i5.p1  ORF type:complete len:215 (-),score=50.83 TRINITY_DN3498_c0_g1_i5:596-1240(-)